MIDDDPQIRSRFQKILEAMGHRVLAAGNGIEGLDLFHQRGIELVVTNVFTPENDGLEVIMTLRREAPTVPIIGFSDRAVRYKFLNVAKKHGENRTVGGSCLVSELLQAVQNSLQKREPPQQQENKDRSAIYVP